MAKEKYISLKEAAAQSGYTADYVGQLIRRGKLPGKQVFSHVAWMTTEEALQEYIKKNKKDVAQPNPVSWKEKLIDSFDFSLISKVILGATIAFVAIFILFLIYIFSVSIDRNINNTYQQKLERV